VVLPGQFLERATLIATSDGFVLEGVSHRGTHPLAVLILPPPPTEGGGMDSVLGAEIAYAAASAGHATLRFNFRGVGASQGLRSNAPTDWLLDARAAFELARDNVNGGDVAVVSLGASDALAQGWWQDCEILGWCFVNPTLLGADDLQKLERIRNVMVVLSESQAATSSALLSELTRRQQQGEVIAGTDRTFVRQLPQVGKAVVRFLRTLKLVAM
jgi:uncharacterized protein